MSRLNQLKILFCIKIFFGLCNAIVNNENIFKNMSLEERKSFFGTEDGSIPEFEVVELIQPQRSKRAAQDTLQITFNYHAKRTTAILSVVEDHELVSPTTTGIWFAEHNVDAHNNVSYTPKPDIYDRIGNFDFFQNLSDCSAITKFWDSTGHITMMGVLKGDYGLSTLPRGYEDGFFQVSDMKRRSTNPIENEDENTSLFLVIFKIPEVPLQYFRRRGGAQNSSFPDLDMHRKKRQNAASSNSPNIVYPKLLISPDYGVISREKNVENSVKQLIAHLNAVDMTFRQITNPVVRLKIGGIIIPRDERATPYIVQNTVTATKLNAENALDLSKEYFNHEKYRFEFETYSAVIMMTTISMYMLDSAGRTLPSLSGLAVTGSVCGTGRAIVNYVKGFGGVLAMAHELGHVFNAQHDDGTASACYSNEGLTMVPDVNKGRSLKWSICSLQAFDRFLRFSEASCMHSRPNEVPDAMKSMQGAWLSPTGQCRNRMKDADGICIKSIATCGEIGCRKGRSCFYIGMKPMEGSLGDEGGIKGKRCINQRWVTV